MGNIQSGTASAPARDRELHTKKAVVDQYIPKAHGYRVTVRCDEGEVRSFVFKRALRQGTVRRLKTGDQLEVQVYWPADDAEECKVYRVVSVVSPKSASAS